jgi:hypothetical protein
VNKILKISKYINLFYKYAFNFESVIKKVKNPIVVGKNGSEILIAIIEHKDDIVLFGTQYKTKQFTKKDCCKICGC